MLYRHSCVLSAELLLLLYLWPPFWIRSSFLFTISSNVACFQVQVRFAHHGPYASKDIVHACLMPCTMQGWNQQLQRNSDTTRTRVIEDTTGSKAPSFPA